VAELEARNLTKLEGTWSIWSRIHVPKSRTSDLWLWWRSYHKSTWARNGQCIRPKPVDAPAQVEYHFEPASLDSRPFGSFQPVCLRTSRVAVLLRSESMCVIVKQFLGAQCLLDTLEMDKLM